MGRSPQVSPWQCSETQVGGRQAHSLTGHSGIVNVVAFSPDGRRVVSGSNDRLVKIWDTETGAEVSSFVCGCALRVARWQLFCYGMPRRF